MNIRYRVLVIIGVVVWSLWSLYPPQQTIKLGLDLNGGVQLVLRVDTDDGLRAETNASAARLRDALTRNRVQFTAVEATSPTEFAVSGIQDDGALRNVTDENNVAFERVPQPGGYVFRMRPDAARQLRDDTVQQALETIERRVNELGVAEAVVARYTGRDQLLVQLPGVSDFAAAKRVIRSTAQLRLVLVEQGPFPSRDAALNAYGNMIPGDLELLRWRATDTSGGEEPFYVVRRVAAVTGSDLQNARPSVDELNRPAVAFTLKQDAAERFGTFTEQNIGRSMATVLDDRVMSVATIISRIDRDGQIAGVSREEMLEQVITFRSGALPADLEYIEERTVGASLGEAAVRAGILASITGLALVALFMVAYYKLTGLNALVSIALNLLILMALVGYVPVTLTLPGIAGLILTIGMGVDSNVLIFERIKEELAAGKTAREAVTAAFNRVWITIVDTHVASLIAAAFLYQFGTIPIKGFATTLTIGLLANVFTAVFVSKTLFLLLLRGARSRSPSIQWRRRFITPDIDFGRWRRIALAFSAVVITAGAAAMMTRGFALGIDFSGGTLVVVQFQQPGVTEDAVREAVAPLAGEEVVQQYGAAEERQFLIRRPLPPGTTQGDSLDIAAREVAHALDAGALPPFEVVSRELVSAVIGEDLQWRGIYATLGSIAAIAAYMALRFRLSFAVGGIVATVHDILVTLGCLALAGYDLSLNVTAALLTITGYSVNDTIVIFDRVRETSKGGRREPLAHVVNRSVNQTLSRTIITAGTTFLAVLALYLFGGDALEPFAFTMLIGIVTGTYSTIFIASAIAIMLSRQKRRAPASERSDGAKRVLRA